MARDDRDEPRSLPCEITDTLSRPTGVRLGGGGGVGGGIPRWPQYRPAMAAAEISRLFKEHNRHLVLFIAATHQKEQSPWK